ncbi:MAG: hypothetical protein L0211_20860, partial [Planctomycetaceae bacterium]|nr:hypothetical protein [Planctomycetaceae bacterium]
MDPNLLRLEIIEAICRLPTEQLGELAAALRRVGKVGPHSPLPQASAGAGKDWPHAPLHRLTQNGTYSTHAKSHIFRDPDRLSLLEHNLLSLAQKYDWRLEAWAVFSNHYHFVGHTLSSPARLKEFLTDLHANTAREVNRLDGATGRQVWHNYWDKQLTYEKSYLARLNYVHQNPVKHQLVPVANQ